MLDGGEKKIENKRSKDALCLELVRKNGNEIRVIRKEIHKTETFNFFRILWRAFSLSKLDQV